jgi:crotonobetainyl-CoA:carnitine CoA-transferase CaiB-like acyl-CoA transferase
MPATDADLGAATASAPGLFAGIRVLEVSAWVMVPGAGVLLGDLGAEVIKVEHPRAGDPARGLVTGGKSPSVGSVNMMVEQTNRGKRSIGLDMAHPAGREILLQLAAESDVFLTSLLPDVRKKLGIDVDDIRAVNPKIIYAMADAVGSVGPEQGKPGFDSAVFFGRAGILNSFSKNGVLPTPRPGFGDKTAAMSLAYGVAAALFKRERTGEPSVVETSLLASACWVASSDIIYSQVVGGDFSAVERPATNPLANTYETSDGRWLMLSMLAPDRWWKEFCATVGREDLIDDARFADAGARAANAAECVAEFSATFASKTQAEWLDVLADFRGPWEAIRNSYEVGQDQQARANGYLTSIEHPAGVDVSAVRTPVRVDGVPHDVATAPDAWQHTEEILLELGFDWDRIIELKTEGVVP